jgi:hypothetical protein
VLPDRRRRAVGRFVSSVRVQNVERAADAGAAVQDMGVDHGGLYIAVAEQLLHRADVVAGGEQVRRERMVWHVARLGMPARRTA